MAKVLLFSLLLSSGFPSRTITLPDGPVSPGLLESAAGHQYLAYQGIPYAEPPVGSLRWLPPQPSLGWNETIDGSISPPMCNQGIPGTNVRYGYEDCLILNVYTKEMNESLPVMVWFHGGGLDFGEGGMYSPYFLIDYDIVIVTVNYRLGPWGFLSLDSPAISGNQGFRDQTLALEWVHNNIMYFGGDTNRVR